MKTFIDQYSLVWFPISVFFLGFVFCSHLRRIRRMINGIKRVNPEYSDGTTFWGLALMSVAFVIGAIAAVFALAQLVAMINRS